MTYTVPGRFRLLPYQEEGARFLAKHEAAALLDDMGLGKTPQALMALLPKAPVLVCSPSVVKSNWADEVRRWRPEFTTSIQKRRKTWRWPRPGEVRCTNYAMLPPALREIEALKRTYHSGMTMAERRKLARAVKRLEQERAGMTAPHPGTILIGDEAHMLKTPEATRTRRWRELAARVHHAEGRIWVLTGTPLENRYDEYYAVLQAAGLGSLLFGSRDNFRTACDNGTATDRLRQRTLRRLKIEVLPQLPRKRHEQRFVRLDKDTAAQADALVEAMKQRGLVLEKATLDDIKRAQVDAGLGGHIMSTRVAIAKAKIPYALALVLEAEARREPLVVFSDHRAPVDLIGRRKGWTAITGDEDSATKFARAQRFQKGRLKGVACTIRAAGTGINLDRAGRALFVDLTWTPSKVAQAEDRILRATSVGADSVLYTQLVADHPIERRIAYLLEVKQARIDKVVNAAAVSGDGGGGLGKQKRSKP